MHNCLVLWQFDPKQKNITKKIKYTQQNFITVQSEQEYLLIKDISLLIQYLRFYHANASMSHNCSASSYKFIFPSQFLVSEYDFRVSQSCHLTGADFCVLLLVMFLCRDSVLRVFLAKRIFMSWVFWFWALEVAVEKSLSIFAPLSWQMLWNDSTYVHLLKTSMQ